MGNYSKQVIQFVDQLLAPYAGHWTIDYASFRPLEEQSRDLPLHKRNDLAHVDAFPSRPTNGGENPCASSPTSIQGPTASGK